MFVNFFRNVVNMGMPDGIGNFSISLCKDINVANPSVVNAYQVMVLIV
ncbi:MAG: hypothetical protein LBO69_04920 [Ignavibacteria bacterium]|jgi:hypothetical protein|nr:hypothetical protein [Ignavibacteria bacterium]